MGFFNFRGKKNDGQKKKTDSVKKQVMQVFSPRKAEKRHGNYGGAWHLYTKKVRRSHRGFANSKG